MIKIERKTTLLPANFFEYEALCQCHNADVLYFNRQETKAFEDLRNRVGKSKTFTDADGLLVSRLFENMRSMSEAEHQLDSLILDMLTAYMRDVDAKLTEIIFEKGVNLYTAIRIYSGKTIEAVAEHLDVSTEDVEKWEAGTEIPSEHLASLSEFYMFPPSYFMETSNTDVDDNLELGDGKISDDGKLKIWRF